MTSLVNKLSYIYISINKAFVSVFFFIVLDLNVSFDRLLNLEYTERTGILHGINVALPTCTIYRQTKVPAE